MQTTGFRLIAEYFNSVQLELSEKLLMYPHNIKTGRDMSDLLRGEIMAINQVLKLDQAIESFEANQKKFKEIEEKLADQAKGNN